jgi:peroxiredoxin
VAATSRMLDLGTPAPPFALTEVTGEGTITLEDLNDAPVLLVAFICSHCPYVIHVQDQFAELAREYGGRGVAVVGISANDPEISPSDTPEGLAEQKRTVGFDFPYLFDADQSVAAAYGAVCTPDFFVFDAARTLVYRGRMDDSRPTSDTPVTGADLRAALDAALAGDEPSTDQHPSMGCSIKWSPGNEPA